MSRRPLKVYHWSGFRSDVPQAEDRHGQVDCYVAATTKTEAVRHFDASKPRCPVQPREVSETRGPAVLALCLPRPGVVFWCGTASRFWTDVQWHEVPTTKAEG